MAKTKAERSKIAREKAKRLKEENDSLLRYTRKETKLLFDSIIDHVNIHSPSCPILAPTSPRISAIFPLKDNAENVTLRFCIGSHRAKLVNNSILIHPATEVTVEIPPTFCALFHHHGMIHGGGPSKATSPTIFSIYAPTRDRVGISNQNYAVSTKCERGCSVCSILSSYKSKLGRGKALFRSHDLEKIEVGDHATEHDLWHHGFAIVKVLTNKEFNQINKEDLNHFLEKTDFKSINQEVYKTKGKRKMLDEGFALNANVVIESKLSRSTLKAVEKVDDVVSSYMSKRYFENYILKGRTFLKNSGHIMNQELYMDNKSLCTC